MRKPKPKDETEWWVKAQVKQILKDTGWKSWMPSPGMFGRSGVSDFLAVKLPRMFMAVETKYDDMPTPLQHEFLEMIHAAGHYAFIVDETNIEKFRTVLTHEHMRQEDMRGGELYHFESLMRWRDPYEYRDILARKLDKQRTK